MTGRPPAQAPPLPGGVIFDQRWSELLFVHWPVRPEDVAQFMPAGVRVDVWDNGLTYVGLVPFRMEGAGFGRGHPVPWLGTFLEWNVRLYSVDDKNRHGVVFRTLDATRLAVVVAANLGGVPYRWARISTRRDPDGTIEWRMRRRLPEHPTSILRVRVGDPVEPTPLEVFLTARWGMHGNWRGRAIWVPNQHGPWPLHGAQVLDLDDELVAAAGITVDGPPLRALWSPGVQAQFSRPQRVQPHSYTPARSRVSGRIRRGAGTFARVGRGREEASG